MAHKTIRIDEKAFDKALEASQINERSVSGQVLHWMNIGRAIEQSPDFSMKRVEAALRAELKYDNLTPEEAEVWRDKFYASMGETSQAEKDFYANLAAEAESFGITGDFMDNE